jgi:Alpha-glutamyl/putrescinyl thymine pyrophosphorylase clade 3
VRPRDRELAGRLEAALLSFDQGLHPLPGIHNAANRGALIEQLLESIHRVQFVAVLQERKLSELRAEPNNALFDPLKAAILCRNVGKIEEAFWLVFLFVHFGKHARAGWRYAREVYGRLGNGARWDWASTSADPAAFRKWLNARQGELKRGGVPRGFGNHRKYESLAAYSRNGTGSVVESYVRWVNPPRTHQKLMQHASQKASGDPRRAFDILYHSMKVVARFGRTARFDYLTMVGKLGLAPIEPPSTYMQGSTGPVQGARLLFGKREGPANLDRWLVELDSGLSVGMQVLEDALCNWQKSPARFKPFRG